MNNMEWTTIEIGKNKDKVKIIGDNGSIKIIIGGPMEDGKYWWHVKVEEKGHASTIKEARQAALDSVQCELEELK